MDKKKPSCPKCNKNDQVIEIIYGRPSQQAIEAAERGELRMGGCCLSPDDKDNFCKRCDAEF